VVNLKKIKHCKKGRRCHYVLSCPTCGSHWHKRKFKAFAQCFDEVTFLSETPLTYIVISSNKLGTLREKSKILFELLEKIRELKKRGKLPIFFGRLEFSFNESLGFNPHLNLIVWGDYSMFKNLSHELNLRFWYKKKTNDNKTAKSIAWYMLKFNNIGIEEGEAVRKVLNRQRTIIHSKEFTYKEPDYIDDIIDFSFMGTYPIKSKEQIRLEKEHRFTLKKQRIELKEKIKTANAKMWSNLN